ncbi:MAG: hypothetical protein Kow0031_15420 [Anaerolineae bacterium]
MIKRYAKVFATSLLVVGLLLALFAGVISAQTADNVVLEGQLGGESYAVDWAGSNAYVGVGPRLVVVDTSNPANPVVLRQSAPLPDVIQSVRYFDGWLYVAAGDSGLFVLNPNTTGVPVVGHYDTAGFAKDVDLILRPTTAEKFAFVADDSNGVLALNVHNPANITLFDTFQVTGGTAEAVSVDLVGEAHVYVAYGDEGLHVWRPFHLAADGVTLAPESFGINPGAGSFLEGVYAILDYIYVADGGYGLRIYQWVEPTETFAAVGSLSIPWSYVESLTVNAGASHAYLVGGGKVNGGLTVVNLSNKAAPSSAGYFELPGYAYNLAIDSAFENAFVADGAFGLRVVNIKTLSNMSEKSAVAGVGQPQDVALNGNYAFLADGVAGLKIVNTTDPTDPTLARAFWPQVTDAFNFTGVAVSGSHLFMAEDSVGLRVFNVTSLDNPGTPTQIATVPLAGLVNDITVAGSYAYVANDADGLRVIDISTPAGASEVGFYSDSNGEAYDVAVAGNYAFVAYGTEGLQVVNINNPAAPAFETAVTVGAGSTPIGFAEGVALFGNYAYVADSSNGLHVINISDPLNPVAVGFVSTPGGPANVSAAGRYYVLVADYADGLRVVDVSDPANPTSVGYYNTAGLSVGVAHGGYAYVADADGGFYTLNALTTDLAIQKTDGLDSAMQGETITYTIRVDNLGAHHADAVQVADTFPAEVTGVTWSCTAAAGSSCPAGGSGDIDATVSVAAGEAITFTASGVVSATAGVVLQNSATVSALPGVDSNPDNNSATDTTATASTDLSVTKTDNQTEVVPGTVTTYTITVHNSAGMTATNAIVKDTLPAALLNGHWSCIAGLGGECPTVSSGNGNINTTVNLYPNGFVTFRVSGKVNPAANGTLTNTVTVDAPAGILDSDTANNRATDTSALTPQVDVQVSKSHTGSAVPGTAITYTIQVSNTGPSVTAVDVEEIFPAGITNVAWTCDASAGSGCPAASGSGNITGTLSLLVNGRVTFEAVGLVSPSATGAIKNVIVAAVPAGVTDINPANNAVTDTLIVGGYEADLWLTQANGVDSAKPGSQVTYIISVGNDGPSHVTGAVVSDTFPAALTNVSWTCSASSGSSCPASGSGDINATVDLLAGGQADFTVAATIDPAATGSLSNSATVSAPTDPNSANNSATDTDSLTSAADLSLTLNYSGSGTPGTALAYTIKVANNGPSDAPGAVVSDTFPAALTNVTWTCSASSGSSCPSGGSGDINATVNLAAGGMVTVSVQATIQPSAGGLLSNSAAVVAPSGVADGDSANNSATKSFTVGAPQADLQMAQRVAGGDVPGAVVTYTLTVTNAGPSNVSDAPVVDNFPAGISGISWSCAASGAGSSCGAGSGSGNINTTVSLGSGDTATLVAVGRVDATAVGPLSNVSMVAAPNGVTDSNTGNNTASSSLALPATFNLTVSGSSSPNPVVINSVVTFVISVTNHGPGAAKNVQVIDTLPSGANLISAQGQGDVGAAATNCHQNGQQVSCTIDQIGNGQTEVLEIKMTATADMGSMEVAVFGNGDTNGVDNLIKINATVELLKTYLPIIIS